MNDENDEDLKNLLSEYLEERKKLKPTPSQQSIHDAIVEGNKMIETVSLPKTTKTPKQSGKAINPYVRAKNEILDKLPNWRKKEILTMDKNSDTDNKIYSAFVKEVAILGDSLS